MTEKRIFHVQLKLGNVVYSVAAARFENAFSMMFSRMRISCRKSKNTARNSHAHSHQHKIRTEVFLLLNPRKNRHFSNTCQCARGAAVFKNAQAPASTVFMPRKKAAVTRPSPSLFSTHKPE